MIEPNKKDTFEETDTPEVTIEDVNRVLEVGRLLKSVLTEEELGELARKLTPPKHSSED